MQKIVVLLKQTFDTEEKIIVTSEGVDEGEAKFVINPYDEYALEEALRLRERHGAQVIVVTCGPERSQEALRTALAVGADEAIRLDSAGLPDDGFVIAEALAAVIAPLNPDLMLAGLFAVDTGAGSVALQIAERLGLPHASAALKLEIGSAEELGLSSNSQPGRQAQEAGLTAAAYALVERDAEGNTETVALALPALITAQQGLNEPRYPSLPGIMKAKRKPLRVIYPSEIQLDAKASLAGGQQRASFADSRTDSGEAHGSAGADAHMAQNNVTAHGSAGADAHMTENNAAAVRTVRTALFPPPARPPGRVIAGTPAEQAAALVTLLQTEAKLLN